MGLNNTWINQLNLFQAGRIWWLNLQYDIEADNLASAVVESLYDAINNSLHYTEDDSLQYSGNLTPHFNLIESVIRANPAAFDLPGRRLPAKTEKYSRVIGITFFALYNVNLAELGLEMDEQTGDMVWDLLGNLITNQHYTGYMKTTRGFFWCTPTRRLLSIQLSKGAGAATEIRNRLGLNGVGNGQRLLRIDIPERNLTGRRICAPTTLDAGTNIVFVPSHDGSGVGWTIDLHTVERGVEELIVEQLPFTKDFNVTKLGIVNEPCPPLDLDSLEKLSQRGLDLYRKRTPPNE